MENSKANEQEDDNDTDGWIGLSQADDKGQGKMKGSCNQLFEGRRRRHRMMLMTSFDNLKSCTIPLFSVI